jgi:hypothetical protein
MSTAISPAPATAAERVRRGVRDKRVTRTPQKKPATTPRNASALTPGPNVRNGRVGNKRETSNQSLLRRLNNGKRVQAGVKLQRNSRSTRDAKIRQLLNTYLTFAYEMGPGMEVKHFSRYVILIMFSMDQIANSTKNSAVYKNLYEQVGSMSGIVDFKIQQQFATLISGYLRNVGKIKSSASVLLYKTLNQNVLKRQNKSLITV